MRLQRTCLHARPEIIITVYRQITCKVEEQHKEQEKEQGNEKYDSCIRKEALRSYSEVFHANTSMRQNKRPDKMSDRIRWAIFVIGRNYRFV